jgi:acyl-CoA reductase-like NAD-dependent aldehyde dehydrogenase
MLRADEIMDRACQAASAFRAFGQKETDAIVRAIYLAALAERVRLAELAYQETGIGVFQHKVIKNTVAPPYFFSSCGLSLLYSTRALRYQSGKGRAVRFLVLAS